MGDVRLQFTGVNNAELLLALGVAVSIALLGYGVWQLVRRERTRALAALAAGVVGVAAVVAARCWMPLATTASRGLWMLLLAGVVVLAVAVLYSAVYAYLGRRRLMTLLLLRALAILSLLLILFKPALSLEPSAAGRKLALPILVDRSGSMDTVDSPDLPSRYRQAVEALALQKDRLTGGFRVGWRHFAARSQAVDSVEDLSSLAPNGPETDTTDIAYALRQSMAGFAPDEMAAIVLVSDGIHNATGNLPDSLRELSLPVPVYVLGVGSETQTVGGGRNVRLLGVDAPLEAVRNNISELTAKVRLSGWANIPAKVVLSEDGKQSDAQPVSTETNLQVKSVALKWTPGDLPEGAKGPDIRKLKLVVEPNPAESNPDDNVFDLHVLATQPKIRVLYVEGTLRPEYKYLRRILAADPNIKVIAMVRLAENRFLVQGSIDDKTLSGLPKSDEEFALFDVIILGDLDRKFIKDEQMERIRKFVNDGKALLMIGGRTSLGPGGYGGTPIEAALPVVVGGRSQAQETTPFVPQLTAAGAVSPIFAGLDKFFATPSGKGSSPVPDLLGCVTVEQAKPGASVLAIHPSSRNDNGPLVVLAVQQYGKGRSAAFTGDTTWKWYLKLQGMGADSPYHRFWGQLIRWLGGVEKKDQAPSPSVMARLDKEYVELGEEVKLTGQVKDASGLAAVQASAVATLNDDPNNPGEEVKLMATAVAGVYEAAHRPKRSGKFTVTVSATDSAGAALGKDQLALAVAPHSKENEQLARDSASLRAIADRYHGRYTELSALPDVVDEIIQQSQLHRAPSTPTRQIDLYNFTLLFLVFVGLLTAEWLLRRNWQLR